MEQSLRVKLSSCDVIDHFQDSLDVITKCSFSFQISEKEVIVWNP